MPISSSSILGVLAILSSIGSYVFHELTVGPNTPHHMNLAVQFCTMFACYFSSFYGRQTVLESGKNNAGHVMLDRARHGDKYTDSETATKETVLEITFAAEKPAESLTRLEHKIETLNTELKYHLDHCMELWEKMKSAQSEWKMVLKSVQK